MCPPPLSCVPAYYTPPRPYSDCKEVGGARAGLHRGSGYVKVELVTARCPRTQRAVKNRLVQRRRRAWDNDGRVDVKKALRPPADMVPQRSLSRSRNAYHSLTASSPETEHRGGRRTTKGLATRDSWPTLFDAHPEMK